MRNAQWIAMAIAFFGTLVIAGVALYFVFDDLATAFTPALVIAGCMAFAVHLSQRKGNSIR